MSVDSRQLFLFRLDSFDLKDHFVSITTEIDDGIGSVHEVILSASRSEPNLPILVLSRKGISPQHLGLVKESVASPPLSPKNEFCVLTLTSTGKFCEVHERSSE